MQAAAYLLLLLICAITIFVVFLALANAAVFFSLRATNWDCLIVQFDWQFMRAPVWVRFVVVAHNPSLAADKDTFFNALNAVGIAHNLEILFVIAGCTVRVSASGETCSAVEWTPPLRMSVFPHRVDTSLVQSRLILTPWRGEKREHLETLKSRKPVMTFRLCSLNCCSSNFSAIDKSLKAMELWAVTLPASPVRLAYRHCWKFKI